MHSYPLCKHDNKIAYINDKKKKNTISSQELSWTFEIVYCNYKTSQEQKIILNYKYGLTLMSNEFKCTSNKSIVIV